MSLLDEALELADAGWEIFPLRGKVAALSCEIEGCKGQDPSCTGGHGFKDGTTDSGQIVAWWRQMPNANIGIAVPIGMVVVDIDPRHDGLETLAAAENEHGKLPLTLSVRTGSGGFHRYFKTNTDGMKQSPLGPGLDTRVGGKGYVLAPPSIHPETGEPYEWIQPAARVALLPGWICIQLKPEPKSSRVYASTGGNIDGSGILGWAYHRVRSAAYGAGHDTLRNTAILLGGYVAIGQLSESDCRSTLRQAADSWQDRYSNAYRTIDDGLEHGRGRPLEVG